jgi:hypothetical protein
VEKEGTGKILSIAGSDKSPPEPKTEQPPKED